jgi:hypothetical protein
MLRMFFVLDASKSRSAPDKRRLDIINCRFEPARPTKKGAPVSRSAFFVLSL